MPLWILIAIMLFRFTFTLIHSLPTLRCVLIPAAEVTISNLTLARRTNTTLNVTWSAGYPKCYSFTVSHSTQDGSINVIQAAESDTSHTLTSLQPGTTYRIEVEAVRKGDGADRQMAKVIGIFNTDGDGEEWWSKADGGMCGVLFWS